MYWDLVSLLVTISNLSSGIKSVNLEMNESIATYQAFLELYFKSVDPFQWLVKIYEFFTLDNTLPHCMVSITSYYMEGETWEWFQDVEALDLCTNWVHFICTLQDQFRSPNYNPCYTLHPCHQFYGYLERYWPTVEKRELTFYIFLFGKYMF